MLGRLTTIELVRHAEALTRREWMGRPDDERPLSERGRAQAAALAEALGAGPIAAIYTSPTVRCRQTVEGLADAAGVGIQAAETLGEASTLPVLEGGSAWVASAWLGGRALGLLDRLAREHEGGRVIACSHGDVIPAALAVLAGRDALGLTDVQCPKAGWFTLTFEGAHCVGARLNGPPEV